MSTPISDIYKAFLKDVRDGSLARLDKEVFYETLFDLLEKSAMLEFSECPKDLSKLVADKWYSQVLETNGSDTVFLINELPPAEEEIEIVILSDGEVVNIDNYTINLADNTITFFSAPKVYEEISVNWTVEGHFKEDLTREEMLILAKGMTLHWLDKQIMREESLEANIGDRDISVGSNANMLSKATDLKRLATKTMKRYKTTYSFSYSPENFS